MPELPEVEVTRLGIAPYMLGQRVANLIIRQPKLRWLIPESINTFIGQKITSVERRAKYLLLGSDAGLVILHLGMSGSLRVLPVPDSVTAHDHFDIQLTSGYCVRFTDPRRFGAVLWTEQPPQQHPLLAHLAPEPFSERFSGCKLFNKSRNRAVSIKSFIMNARHVVGIGNIYASEVLFAAKMHPAMPVEKINKHDFNQLVVHIKQVLTKAIAAGGTTLNDFSQADGRPGYFSQQLCVYGRAGQTCMHCGTYIEKITIANRASYLCPKCQTLG